MTPEELKACRERLVAFVEPVLERLGRAERRRWGLFCLQRLLLEGGSRKTAAGMAARYRGNEQAVQQFVNQSPQCGGLPGAHLPGQHHHPPALGA